MTSQALPPDDRVAAGRAGGARTRLRAAWSNARVRILTWATIVVLIIGMLELGEPVEGYLRAARNAVRQRPPSGDIVVVAIDDRSVGALGQWPWSRALHAEILKKVKAAGARRVFYDVMFTTADDPQEDAAFANVLKRSGPVYMPGTYTIDPITMVKTSLLPIPLLRRHVGLVSIKLSYSSFASVWKLPYATEVAGQVVPSMSAQLSGRFGPLGEDFPVDYAYDLKKVRTISIVDVMQSNVDLSILKGKDIILGINSREMGDLYFLPGKGLVNGAYVLVAGAETLKRGRPIDLGWIFPLAFVAGLGWINLFARRRWVWRTALGAGVVAVTLLPMVGEAHLIFIQIVPAIVHCAWVGVGSARHRFCESYKAKGDINALSGLPNLNALRSLELPKGNVLVSAKVRNFAEVSAALPPAAARLLIDQIIGRLSLGAHRAQIYQGDDGIFVWASLPDLVEPDQLDALHSLFRSPAIVDRQPIDISVSFGVDTDDDREIANRIGATLVAAEEAAAEGARWKIYDPAKRDDAEWRLSLLGRLDRALDAGEIWVAYQPQLDLKTGRISGAEALVRWSHPEKGEISPAEFVLAAEQHDRIERLTQFVLKDAIRVAADFNARGICFNVAVNLSARLLEMAGLTASIRTLLADARLDPAHLTLEVTESAAMTSGRASIRTLEELGSIGISISIDDYGTGFSTLEYFKLIPAAEVKIDKSFVTTIARSASDRLMVRSTLELAHSLGRSVVAEGVETSEMLAALTEMGCDRAQGYLIGRPMTAEQLAVLIGATARVDAARFG